MRKIKFNLNYKDNIIPISESVFSPEEIFLNSADYMLVSDNKRSAYNIACAFDIETTNMREKELKDSYGFMYLWQFCIVDKVYMGRTWKEFEKFMFDIVHQLYLNSKRYLVIYVHNLAFEFSYMAAFLYRMTHNIEIFFSKKRQPLFIRLKDLGIEFRCSYKLSNMSLGQYTKNYCAMYSKLSGADYNYNILRTPLTFMKDSELGYGYCDVRGLCECIQKELKEFNILNIPLTSTGFVRRDTHKSFKYYDKYKSGENVPDKFLRAFKQIENCPSMIYSRYKSYRQYFQSTAITSDIYNMCKEVMRGGDTHANILKSGSICKNVFSYDKVSSYPWQQLSQNRYPVGKWRMDFDVTEKHINQLLDDVNKCFMCTLYLSNVSIKSHVRNPYLSFSKCKIEKGDKKLILDNGRVARASHIITSVTNIDYEILLKDYDFTVDYIENLYTCAADYLPEPIRAVNILYFIDKCELKGVDDYLYMKSKNKLNAIFGMTCTDMIHDNIIWDFIDCDYKITSTDLTEGINKFYSKPDVFMRYDWGVWTCAFGRYELHKSYEITGDNYLYSDTDSNKWEAGLNMESIRKKFEEENGRLMEKCLKCGAHMEVNGKHYYMGQWEDEGEGAPLYDYFVTHGAKKYAYEYNDIYVEEQRRKGKKDFSKFGITVAGLSKEKGAKYFKSVKNFKTGTLVSSDDSGRKTAVWKDEPIHTIIVNGEEIETAGSLSLFETTYQLNSSSDKELLIVDGLINLI